MKGDNIPLLFLFHLLCVHLIKLSNATTNKNNILKMNLEKGTIISSGVYNITSLQYANIHFYTDPTTGRSAYDSGYDYNNTTYKAPTGSYKLLARIRYWLDGGTRTFVVPAIQVVS